MYKQSFYNCNSKSPETKPKQGIAMSNPFIASLFKDYYNIL